MMCHVLSWGRSVPRSFAPVRRLFARHCGVLSVHRPGRPRCRRSVPLPRIMRARVSRRRARAPACARRWGRALRPVGVGGRLRSFVPPRSGPGAGRGVPVSRVSCVCAGGRIAAARFARVIARVRAGRAEGAPLPSARAGAFAAPQPLPSAESGKAAPGAAFLSCLFYTIPLEVKPFQEQKNENDGQLSHSPLNRRDNLRRWIRRSAAARNEQRTGTSPPVSGLDFADRALVPDSAGSEGSRRIGTRIGAHGRFSNGLRDGRRRAVLPRPVRRSASGNGPGGGCGGRTARRYSSCRRRVSTPRRASGRARSCPPAPRCGASGRPPVPRAG